MPTTTEESLELAAHVLTGIELEVFLTDGRPRGEYWTADRLGHPGDAWAPGWDCSNAELRSARPSPLGEQSENLAQLRTWLSGVECEYGSGRSFHVHVNTDPSKGGAVDRDAFFTAWMEMRDEAYTLVANTARLTSTWCVPILDTATHLPSDNKSMEATTREYHGSIEIRLFDATDSEELHEARLEFLQRLIARSLDLADQTAAA